MIKSKLQAFWHDTSGAVTVDWTVWAGAGIVIFLAVWGLWEPSADDVTVGASSYFDNINENANY